MIKLGIIGYGYWGPNIVRNFMEAEGATVKAVSDTRPERLKLLQSRYPAIETMTEPDALFADPEIDAVAVVTPVSTHYELAKRALQADKHVLLEKPFTETSAQGQELLNEAEKRGLVIMVDHTFVYTGAVRKIKELVESGELGDIYYYDSVRVNLGLFQHDVNVVWDLAVHDLSILEYIYPGKPVAVSATGTAHVPGSPEDVAYLTLFYDNQMISHIHVNWLSPVKVRRTLVGGSHKMVVFDDLNPSEKIKIYDKGISLSRSPESIDQVYKMLIAYRSGDMWAPRIAHSEALRVEAHHFIDCIENGTQPIASGESGLRVVRILEAASESMKNQGQPVKL
ncbi:MAG: Gfo/Idh/MocA family oxidoreductase [Anaerolineaceae bacterium]|nr:Gfo/Idh/MocA family oxidoreductase [Anaerolineaceae bacterium]